MNKLLLACLVLAALRLVAYAMLSILATDVLYLYYAGGWREPITGIRIAELCMLYALIPLGILLFILEVKKLK